MIAVFIVGYIAQFAITGWVSRLLQLFLQRVRQSEFVTTEDKTAQEDGLPTAEEEKQQRRHQEPGRDHEFDDQVPGLEEMEEADPELQYSDGEKRKRSPSQASQGSSAPTDVESQTHAETLQWSRKATISQYTGMLAASCRNVFKQTPKRPDTRGRHERWADIFNTNVDVFQYLLFFAVIGIPVYYTIGYTMPIFLSLTVLMFHAANAVPKKIKRVAHPVLVTALLTVLVSWVISLTQGNSLQWGLQQFKTGNSYLQYFIGVKGLPPPGAGDILTSMLDASIVALAMPMYKYRRELWHFVRLLPQSSLHSIVIRSPQAH